MTAAAWAQLLFLIALLAISTPLLGRYLAKVFGGGKAPGDRIFGPVERVIYRAGGIDPDREQRWTVYALSLLAFSLVSRAGALRPAPPPEPPAAQPRPPGRRRPRRWRSTPR